ncbi:MAG: hypothetical protein HKN92_10855 [Chitinophagales bacterium]|nr:hypothetical protein [Chitinophagales bacterium]
MIVTLTSCKQDEVLIPGNNPPGSNAVSSIIIENYVNKCFIDLLGREPIDDEMVQESSLIKEGGLADSVKLALVQKLQFDSNWVEGDSSYHIAYNRRLYDISKVRMVEGISDGDLNTSIGIFSFQLESDSLSGDSAGVARWRDEIKELRRVLRLQYQFRSYKISISEVFRRLIDNSVYDEINMNTFNFINATFDNLYYRFPTTDEFDNSWTMIEDNSSVILLGRNGHNRGDYMDIVTSSEEFYEGLIRWQFETLMGREATADESLTLLKLLLQEGYTFQQLQQYIMIDEDYSNF